MLHLCLRRLVFKVLNLLVWFLKTYCWIKRLRLLDSCTQICVYLYGDTCFHNMNGLGIFLFDGSKSGECLSPYLIDGWKEAERGKVVNSSPVVMWAGTGTQVPDSASVSALSTWGRVCSCHHLQAPPTQGRIRWLGTHPGIRLLPFCSICSPRGNLVRQEDHQDEEGTWVAAVCPSQNFLTFLLELSEQCPWKSVFSL